MICQWGYWAPRFRYWMVCQRGSWAPKAQLSNGVPARMLSSHRLEKRIKHSVWKPLPSRRVLKPWVEGQKGKPKKRLLFFTIFSSVIIWKSQKTKISARGGFGELLDVDENIYENIWGSKSEPKSNPQPRWTATKTRFVTIKQSWPIGATTKNQPSKPMLMS